jgi:hypothetical protein
MPRMAEVTDISKMFTFTIISVFPSYRYYIECTAEPTLLCTFSVVSLFSNIIF